MCNTTGMENFATCEKKHTGYAFAGVEKLLWENFLPRFFIGRPKYPPPIVGTLSTRKVKKYGLGLENPPTSANKKILSLQRAIMEFIRDATRER